MKDLNNILGYMHNAKRLIQEFQELSPVIKDQLGSLVSELRNSGKNEQQIYDAIQFAVNRVKSKPTVVLGVYEDDPPELIRQVFHTKAKFYHPDTGGSNADVKKFNEIREAYDKLINGG